MGDWLGTGRIANRGRSYRSFEEARAYAQSLKLKNQMEWYDFKKSDEFPADVPGAPYKTYKHDGWAGWGDWLGTGYVAPGLRKYRPYKQARSFTRLLNLSSEREWREFVRSGNLPEDIPSRPDSKYRDDGWAGMGDWLGTDR